MKTLLFPIILFIAYGIQNIYGQSTVIGSISDSKGQPIINGNVLLLKSSDSSLIKGVVSDKAGYFNFFKIQADSYIVFLTHVGYTPIYTPAFTIAKDNHKTDLGKLRLTEAGRKLDGVTVVTKKPVFEQKIDRMVINVANNIISAGSTVLDILERSPGVIVDHQDNSIAIGGKSGVFVMINGRRNNMPLAAVFQMLAGMSSANIERIELITIPPANYDAEGNAGYINIVLKQNNQFGTNGSYSGTAGFGRGDILSSTLNINHRKAKMNLYGELNFLNGERYTLFTLNRIVSQPGRSVLSKTKSDETRYNLNMNGKVGFDYELTKKTIIGGIVSAYKNNFWGDLRNSAAIAIDNKLDTAIDIIASRRDIWKNISTNLNIAHTFSKFRKLSVNLDYIYYTNNNPSDYRYKFIDGRGAFIYEQQAKTNKITPITFWVQSADYSTMLSKKVSMESGIKSTFSILTNNVDLVKLIGTDWLQDKEYSGNYKLKENILAAYTSIGLSVSEKTSFNAGLRYEYTNSNLGSLTTKNIVDRHYGKLFPSFYLSHKLKEASTINISYSKRINRPTFNEIVPKVTFYDPNTLFAGNPALQPSISNSVKTDYLYKKIFFSLTYSYEKNPITRHQPKIDPATNKHILASENLPFIQTLSAVISIPVTLTKRLAFQTNATGTMSKLKAVFNNSPVYIKQKNLRLTSSLTLKLPKEYVLDISGFYQTRFLFSLIYKAEPLGAVNFGVQKKLKDNKSKVIFNMTDIFKTQIQTYSVNFPQQNVVSWGDLFNSQPLFKFTFTRTFGNDKLKDKRNRTTAEEERARVQ